MHTLLISLLTILECLNQRGVAMRTARLRYGCAPLIPVSHQEIIDGAPGQLRPIIDPLLLPLRFNIGVHPFQHLPFDRDSRFIRDTHRAYLGSITRRKYINITFDDRVMITRRSLLMRYYVGVLDPIEQG